ncbi:hypothetical protein F3Y22_tig00111254pilonHSYRG00088 [Hibiscus syriacus]|uniref:RNase H type-1 domain-containing protein n=1 Tax=Hibiscus syriacus TaxID=106335 RepID=A0A6A2YSK2_HIBSY|nr:hypothetical protein F3Y22_tig00111254pilonHSYRG00088 [Hibiscus syriacus]
MKKKGLPRGSDMVLGLHHPPHPKLACGATMVYGSMMGKADLSGSCLIQVPYDITTGSRRYVRETWYQSQNSLVMAVDTSDGGRSSLKMEMLILLRTLMLTRENSMKHDSIPDDFSLCVKLFYVDHENELITEVQPHVKWPFSGKYYKRWLSDDGPRGSTGTDLCDSVFHGCLDKFLVIYLDDVMMFSTFLEGIRIWVSLYPLSRMLQVSNREPGEQSLDVTTMAPQGYILRENKLNGNERKIEVGGIDLVLGLHHPPHPELACGATMVGPHIALLVEERGCQLAFAMPCGISPPRVLVDLDVMSVTHWSPPSSIYLTLNTNGASQGNPGVAGAGGLLRDENGAWVMGFAAHLRICTNVAAKLFAIRMGLSLAWKYGYGCFVCEVGSQLTLNLINNCHSSSHPLGSLIEDIRSFKARNRILTFQHIHREGNLCADILSRLWCFLEDDLVIFSAPPAEVSRMLEVDRRDVSFPRDFFFTVF